DTTTRKWAGRERTDETERSGGSPEPAALIGENEMVARLLTSPIPILLITLAVASPSIGQVGPAPTTPTAPRDVRPSAQNGTAVIRGRVIAGDTRRPLRRAQITVSSPELGRDSRSSSTDADGRYEVKDLPAGRYTVTVRRAGYLSLRYG